MNTNKNIVIAGVLGVVALLGIWWYMASQQAASDKMMMEKKAMEEKAMKEKDAMKKEESMKKDEAMMKKDEGAMMKSYTVSMKEQNGSKQIGTATIADVDGKAKVTVKVAAGA